MANHGCPNCIITCIDFRFQEYINDWTNTNLEPRSFDRVAFAGGVKDLETILGQIAVSKRLHNITKVILVNHEDCGAYGPAGTPEKHAEDLKAASDKVREQYPDIEVDTYYLHLDGQFEKTQ